MNTLENDNKCVSIVIPARDEAGNIAFCIESLLQQEKVFEIIIVDDHSADGTASVVEKYMKNNDMIKLVSAPPLPDGWLGKTHALHTGAHLAAGKFILFTDADVIFSKDVIASSVIVMEQNELDLLSGMFGIYCRTVSEKISAPVLSAAARIAFFFTASKGAGTGAFNMVRKSAYFAAGGHLAIRKNIVDDVALARLMREFSHKTQFVPDLSKKVKVRLFEGWNGFWRAISRSAIPFLGNNKLLAVTLAIPFVTISLLVLLAPALAPLLLAFPGHYCFWSGLGLFFLYLCGAGIIASCKGWCSGSSLWIFFYPLPLLIIGINVIFSAINTMFNPEIEWRGRIYAAKDIL